MSYQLMCELKIINWCIMSILLLLYFICCSQLIIFVKCFADRVPTIHTEQVNLQRNAPSLLHKKEKLKKQCSKRKPWWLHVLIFVGVFKLHNLKTSLCYFSLLLNLMSFPNLCIKYVLKREENRVCQNSSSFAVCTFLFKRCGHPWSVVGSVRHPSCQSLCQAAEANGCPESCSAPATTCLLCVHH